MTDAYPIRKSPRAQWLDYNGATYFVTICTKEMRHFFGEIYDNEMHLSPIGQYLHNELSAPTAHHPHIDVPLFTVMPNHIHMIVTVGTQRAVSAEDEKIPPSTTDTARRVPTSHTLLGSYIASLKSSVTRYANQIGLPFKWQPRYHDHVIRGIDDANNIGRYITENVLRWQIDRFNIR